MCPMDFENANASAELDEGLCHLAGGRWIEAVSCLRAALRREPGRLAIARGLVSAYIHGGDAEAARRVIKSFTSEQPLCAEGWRLAAQLEWKLGLHDEALKVIGRGLDHLPHSPILHQQAALLLGARGKMAESSRHADRAASAASRIEPWIAAAAGRPGSAADMLQSADRISSTNPKLDPDYFDRLVQDPKLLEGLLSLPAEQCDMEMLRAMEFRLAKLLESQPHHADRQLLLARLQHRIGAIPAATLSVQRALKVNPSYIQAHRLHATLSADAGDLDGALRILEGLIARGLDWPDLHVQMAELQERRGRAESARSHLYSAIRVNPSFARAKELLERCAA